MAATSKTTDRLSVARLAKATGLARCATTATSPRETSAVDAMPARMGLRARKKPSRHAKGTGSARAAKTTTLHGEPSASAATQAKMELKVRQQAVVDVEASEGVAEEIG